MPGQALSLLPKYCFKTLIFRVTHQWIFECPKACINFLIDRVLLLLLLLPWQRQTHGKAPEYLKDLMIPSERLHVSGNKQFLLGTSMAIFQTNFSFWGSLTWNCLPHHLRCPMEVKTFKRKAFQTLTKPT